MEINMIPVLAKIQHNLDKWKMLKLSLWEKMNTVKMSILPKLKIVLMNQCSGVYVSEVPENACTSGCYVRREETRY